jgi:hypothetical protein
MPSSARRSRSVKEATQEVGLPVVGSREACLVEELLVVDFRAASRAATQEVHLVVLQAVDSLEASRAATQEVHLVVLQAVDSLEASRAATQEALLAVLLEDRPEASPEVHQVELLAVDFQVALPVELLAHLLQLAVSQEACQAAVLLVAHQVVCQVAVLPVALRAVVSQAVCLLAHLSRLVVSQEALLMAEPQKFQAVLPTVELLVAHQAVSQVACLPVHLSRLEDFQAAHLVVSQAVLQTAEPREPQHQQVASLTDPTVSPTQAFPNSLAPSPSTTNSHPPPPPSSSVKIPPSPASRSSTLLTVFLLAVLLALPTHLVFHSHSLASRALHQASRCPRAAHPTLSHPTLPASQATKSRRSPCRLKLLASLARPSPLVDSLARPSPLVDSLVVLCPPVDSQASLVVHLTRAFLRCQPRLRLLRADRVQLAASQLSLASHQMTGARRMMAGGGTRSWIC